MSIEGLTDLGPDSGRKVRRGCGQTPGMRSDLTWEGGRGGTPARLSPLIGFFCIPIAKALVGRAIAATDQHSAFRR